MNADRSHMDRLGDPARGNVPGKRTVGHLPLYRYHQHVVSDQSGCESDHSDEAVCGSSCYKSEHSASRGNAEEDVCKLAAYPEE